MPPRLSDRRPVAHATEPSHFAPRAALSAAAPATSATRAASPVARQSICWCSTAVTAVGCSDALEPGGSRGVVFLPLWAVLVGYHSLSAEGVSVRWGSLKG